MCQHILCLGYRTPWEKIEGINKLILKSNWIQDYSNPTYLLSAKMGAYKKITDYAARLLLIFDQLELSLRNSKGRFCLAIFVDLIDCSLRLSMSTRLGKETSVSTVVSRSL